MDQLGVVPPMDPWSLLEVVDPQIRELPAPDGVAELALRIVKAADVASGAAAVGDGGQADATVGELGGLGGRLLGPAGMLGYAALHDVPAGELAKLLPDF